MYVEKKNECIMNNLYKHAYIHLYKQIKLQSTNNFNAI